jgi:hypothetical protein
MGGYDLTHPIVIPPSNLGRRLSNRRHRSHQRPQANNTRRRKFFPRRSAMAGSADLAAVFRGDEEQALRWQRGWPAGSTPQRPPARARWECGLRGSDLKLGRIAPTRAHHWFSLFLLFLFSVFLYYFTNSNLNPNLNSNLWQIYT